MALPAAQPSVPQARAARPVDLVHLAKQCMGDPALEREILQLFGRTLATQGRRLDVAGSFDDLALVLHSLKGAAAGVGAWGIVDLAQTCERELAAGRPLRDERLADLRFALEDVQVYVGELIAA